VEGLLAHQNVAGSWGPLHQDTPSTTQLVCSDDKDRSRTGGWSSGSESYGRLVKWKWRDAGGGWSDQSIKQSNIRLLIRRITRLTQTQAGFTDELGCVKDTNDLRKMLI